MAVKKEAAYHEAGHAVLAHKSKYHAIVGPINLLKYGAGDIYVSLSKSKCVNGGKPEDASAGKDKEVAKDLAVVLCAGLAAEKIASEKDDTLIPNPSCSEPDHALAEQQLTGAGLSKKYNIFEAEADKQLRKHWKLVDKLANELLARQSIDPTDIIEIIENT